MQLSVGQRVVHPHHGIGKIVDVTQMDLVDGFKRYYVIEYLTKRLTSHVPIKKTNELKVRSTMSEEKVEDVLDTLSALPESLPDHHKKRRKIVEDLIQSGRPTKIAQAVRELAWRQERDGLSNWDSQMLSQGKEMLAAEMALVTDSRTGVARRKIEETLTQAIEVHEPQPAH